MVLGRGEGEEKRGKEKNMEWYGPLFEERKGKGERRRKLAIKLSEKRAKASPDFGHTEQKNQLHRIQKEHSSFDQKKGISVLGCEGRDTFLVVVCLGQDTPPSHSFSKTFLHFLPT